MFGDAYEFPEGMALEVSFTKAAHTHHVVICICEINTNKIRYTGNPNSESMQLSENEMLNKPYANEHVLGCQRELNFK